MALVRRNNGPGNRPGVIATLNQILYSMLRNHTMPYDYDKGGQDQMLKFELAKPTPGWTDPSGGGAGGSVRAGRSGNNPRRKKGKEKKQKLSSGDSFRQIGFGPTTGLPSVRVTLTGIFDATTSATGPNSHSAIYNMGYYGAGGMFKLLNSDAKKLFDAFEKSTVHRVSVQYVGTGASTASGHLSMGFDSSTDSSQATAPTTASQVTDRATHVVICDVKGEANLSYSPRGTDKECRNLDTIAQDSEKWCGKFMWSLNASSVPVSTTFGLFRLTVDVTLHQ